jgi:hypothetical protein
VSAYQVVQELTSFRDVAAILKEGESWLFCGTEGWHGTRQTLADCERILRNKDSTWLPDGAYITVFIVNPKNVSIKWGEIHLRSLSEVEWLRERVRETLEKIQKDQEVNT